jgi:hypothetical protein
MFGRCLLVPVVEWIQEVHCEKDSTWVVKLYSGLCALTAGSYAAILSDSFTDQGRTDGTDPYDTDWYFFSHNSATADPIVKNVGGDYKLATDASAANNARMIGAFSDVTLSAQGDYVQVELQYSLSDFNGTKQGFFNLGLYDDGGTPQTEDDMGTTTSLSDDLGYTTR